MSHIPVLLQEVLDNFAYLKDRDGYFVDGTLGAAGHSIALARKFQIPNSKYQIVGIDKDEMALDIAKKNVESAGLIDNFIFVHDDFKNIKNILADLKIGQISGALVDLGVSSMQLDRPERGFSFQDPAAPLDMRMDQSQKLTAADIVNSWNRQRLQIMLKEYGDEPLAGKIAAAIAAARKEKTFETVGDLLSLLERVIPARVRYAKDKHFATNVFRALRIAVNEELTGLEQMTNDFMETMAPGGRLAIITFHSSEDRIIKNAFRKLENPCVCPPQLPQCVCGKKPLVKVITKKPIGPTNSEIASNPRSRSAKLRIVQKV